MKKVSALVGREYKLFNYVGAPDAERVIIAMGSPSTTSTRGRPSTVPSSGIPATCKKIAVLDRRTPGSLGEPLYQNRAENSKTDVEVIVLKVQPPMVKAVYDNLASPTSPWALRRDRHQPAPGRAAHHRANAPCGLLAPTHRWRQQEQHQNHRDHTDMYGAGLSATTP